MKNKEKITKDMTFFEVMEKNPKAGFILMERGLMCGGCAMAQFETIEEGCLLHGIDVNKIIKELNQNE